MVLFFHLRFLLQKYFDQAISGNWSYNPEQYEGNQVPVSVMAKDLLTTYKMGWKTSYYQNTYDGKNDNDEPQHSIGGPEQELKTRAEFASDEAYEEYEKKKNDRSDKAKERKRKLEHYDVLVQELEECKKKIRVLEAVQFLCE